MTETTDNPAILMRRYLLGDLPESEQLALETGFFADGDLLEQVQEIETDLVDQYVRGELSNAERLQFERHYLATPAHKQRVAFARELLRAANEQGLPQPRQPKESFWENLAATLRSRQFFLGAAVAAILLLLFGFGWMAIQKSLWHQARQEERIAELRRLHELESQIAQQNERNTQLNAELERLRAKQSSTASQPSLFSFILLSGVRGDSQQQTLKIPPGTNQIRLQMKIENSDYRRYRVSLRPVDGGESWNPGPVNAVTGKTGTTVSVKVPANRLRPGDYILTLAGIHSEGSPEEINRYFFRLSK